MKERPILMSAPMVRAIIDRRKTQTRRIVKPQPSGDLVGAIGDTGFWFDEHTVESQDGPTPIRCPHGVVGDRLWVRETWAPFHVGQKHAIANPVDDIDDADAVRFKADGRVWMCHNGGAFRPADDGKWTYEAHRWRPSIHMPRWASRILLAITDVRVQRLQDITEEDALAEGYDDKIAFSLRSPFVDAWDANPWVWALTFRRE